MDYIFKADLPYPKIDIKTKNGSEVKLLMPVYGGRESETTAVMGYIYAHYVTSCVDGELSDCLLKLAMTEMRHHDMLGEAIFKLGGTPYIGGNYNYWQGGFVNYEKDPVRILKNSIAAENLAIHDYKSIAARTSLPEIKLMIERIIMDEEVHMKTLSALLEVYSSSFGK